MPLKQNKDDIYLAWKKKEHLTTREFKGKTKQQLLKNISIYKKL